MKKKSKRYRPTAKEVQALSEEAGNTSYEGMLAEFRAEMTEVLRASV